MLNVLCKKSSRSDNLKGPKPDNMIMPNYHIIIYVGRWDNTMYGSEHFILYIYKRQ